MSYRTKYKVGDIIPIKFEITDIDNDDSKHNSNYELSIRRPNGDTVETVWFNIDMIETGIIIDQEARKQEIIHQIAELNKELQELNK